MARPEKIGFEYFPHDCDAAHDEKMESICALYGHHVAYSLIFRLYERIYRAGGKLDVSDPSTMRILCRNVAKMTLPHFEKFLKDCQSFEIFDKSLYEGAKLLTSRGILRRIEPIINKRLRMKDLYNKSKGDDTLISASETPAETMAETRQSKVKERKVYKSSADGLAATAVNGTTKNQSLPPKAGNTPQGRIMTGFQEQYKKAVGEPYLAGTADYAILTKLIKDCGEKLVIDKINSFCRGCKDKTFWFSKDKGLRAISIKTLRLHWQEIPVKTEDGDDI